MSTTIETVKVKRDNEKGYHIINKDSFIEGVHELYEADSKPATPVRKGRK